VGLGPDATSSFSRIVCVQCIKAISIEFNNQENVLIAVISFTLKSHSSCSQMRCLSLRIFVSHPYIFQKKGGTVLLGADTCFSRQRFSHTSCAENFRIILS
jgi:hypothetical protein